MMMTCTANPPRNGEVAGPQGLTEGFRLSAKVTFAAMRDPSVAARHLPVPGRN
jgi:hypothetical protein